MLNHPGTQARGGWAVESQQAKANLACLEVVRNDQVKFSTDSIDPQNCSEWAS